MSAKFPRYIVPVGARSLSVDGLELTRHRSHERPPPRVANQLQSIYGKLGITSRLELAAAVGRDGERDD
jgi:hypothetical protein